MIAKPEKHLVKITQVVFEAPPERNVPNAVGEDEFTVISPRMNMQPAHLGRKPHLPCERMICLANIIGITVQSTDRIASVQETDRAIFGVLFRNPESDLRPRKAFVFFKDRPTKLVVSVSSRKIPVRLVVLQGLRRT